MQVRFINNNGGGFCDEVTVPDGTTVERFVLDRIGSDYQRYNIRVNGREVIGTQMLESGQVVSVIPLPGQVCCSQTLQENDRITVVPKNIAGA